MNSVLATTLALFASLLLVSATPGIEDCPYNICRIDFHNTAYKHQIPSERIEVSNTEPPVVQRANPSAVRRSELIPRSSTTFNAIIKVTSTDDDLDIGYISSHSDTGAFLHWDSNHTTALSVEFTIPSNTTSADNVELTLTNDDLSFGDYLGLIQGHDDETSDMESGSANYGYIAGSGHTDVSSVPKDVGNSYSVSKDESRTSLSSVWSIDLISMALVPKWTNPDGSSHNLSSFFQTQGPQDVVYFTGDLGAYVEVYQPETTAISFSLVIQ